MHTEAAGDGGTDDLTFAATDARYVRVLMTQRTSFTWDPARLHWYGYSLFSLEVYGAPTQVAAAFARSATTVPAGTDAIVPVVLAVAAATDTSVRVRSTGGTGVAGTDYTAVDQVLAFPAGTTEASVTVPTVDHGPLGQVRTVELTPVRTVRRARPGRPHDEHGHRHAARGPARRGRRHGARRLRVGRAAGYTTWGISARRSPRC